MLWEEVPPDLGWFQGSSTLALCPLAVTFLSGCSHCGRDTGNKTDQFLRKETGRSLPQGVFLGRNKALPTVPLQSPAGLAQRPPGPLLTAAEALCQDGPVGAVKVGGCTVSPGNAGTQSRPSGRGASDVPVWDPAVQFRGGRCEAGRGA